MLNLAPHSRVWIFQADRFLNEVEVKAIKKDMGEFMQTWAAHGKDIFGDFALEYDLFLIIGADEQRAPASGCSIDTLMRKVQDLGNTFNVNFLNRLLIAYEDPSTKIHLVTMEHFKQLMSKDEVTGQTTVYNNLVENVAELNEKWRTKVANSWHKNLLQVI